MKPGSRDSMSQQFVRGLSNVSFSFFILGVLIFTVFAIRYQPPDPWVAPEKALEQVLSSVQNATFHADDSVLPTGEDFASSENDTIMSNAASKSDENVVIEEPVITLKTVAAVEETLEEQAPANGCNTQERSINCTEPGVLAAIIKYNLEQFPDLNFYAYQTPVRGADENECDVAWKFRAQKEKSWRKYKDFRRFSLSLEQDCSYKVVDASGWHSGKNAKKLKFTKGTPFGERSQRRRRRRRTKRRSSKSSAAVVDFASTDADFNSNDVDLSTTTTEAVVDDAPTADEIPAWQNVTVLEEVDVIEDSVPVVAPASDISTFNQHRYLFYGRGGDHCKKMNHYLWSFLCALGEAQYLNRTMVVDLNLCLSASHNPGHSDEDGKDFRFYFDYAHLKYSASVVEQPLFLQEWKVWNENHPDNQVSVREVTDSKVTPMELAKDDSTIILRKFEQPEPDNYWYRVCEGETETVIQRPWHLLWKSKRIMDIVNAICGKLEWDFDVVHIVRGEKVANKELWPNLDADTSVESLLANLKDQIDSSRYVYIATNEREPGYFDGLKEVYRHAYTLDDFSDLWAKDSLWYNETVELTGGFPIEFDGYMRMEVDTEVSVRAKKTIETFGFLTKDCKDGINTC